MLLKCMKFKKIVKHKEGHGKKDIKYVTCCCNACYF